MTEHIVPTIVKATSDSIPNVKFCVARVIKANKAYFDPQVFSSEITPKLRELTKDSDKDVAYFATVALQN